MNYASGLSSSCPSGIERGRRPAREIVRLTRSDREAGYGVEVAIPGDTLIDTWATFAFGFLALFRPRSFSSSAPVSDSTDFWPGDFRN